MKRFAGLMVLMALTTPAYAGSYSFVIAGHHIHVATSRNCRSLSCLSWSEVSRKRDRDDTVAAAGDPAPAQKPVAPTITAPAPVVAPATPAPVPAPVATQPAAPVPQPPPAAAPVQTQSAPLQQQASATPAFKPVETRTVVTPPAPAPAKIDPPAPPPVAQMPAAQAPVAQVPAAQVRPEVKVQPKLEPKVETKVDAKVDAKIDAKIDPNAAAKPRVGFDPKPDAKLEPKLEPKSEPKPQPKVEQKAEIKVEQKTETKLDPKSDTRPDTTASVTKTPEKQADKPVVVAKPAPSKTTLQSEGEGVETPIGDWQTEGRKGLVRIEPCGTALCGYMINTSTNAKGETVLINMKPRAKSDWFGSIYSRASGNTYYATMTMKRPNTLRVEACVVGHYFCSGNNWTRIAPKPDDTISPRETREASADPAH